MLSYDVLHLAGGQELISGVFSHVFSLFLALSGVLLSFLFRSLFVRRQASPSLSQPGGWESIASSPAGSVAEPRPKCILELFRAQETHLHGGCKCCSIYVEQDLKTKANAFSSALIVVI